MSKKVKKVTKVQINQPKIAQPSVQLKEEPEEEKVEPEVKKDLQQPIEASAETSNVKLMNVEEATKVAIEFLKTLGIKKVIPNKASNEGNKAYIELDLKDKKAAVLVDEKTKEILEYEIEKSEKSHQTGGGASSFKLIAIMIGIQFLLIILFNFVKPYLQPYIPLP